MKSRVLYIEADKALGLSGMEAMEKDGILVFYRTSTDSLDELLEIWRPHLVVCGSAVDLRSIPESLSSVAGGGDGASLARTVVAVARMMEPYTADELLARVKDRLAAGTVMDELLVGDFAYVPGTRLLRHRGHEVARLTPQMSKVFEILLRRQGEIVSTSFLLDSVWERSVANRGQCLMNVIGRLREVLRRDKRVVIKAVYKYGYMLYGRSGSAD